MEAYRRSAQKRNTIFVGVDLHRLSWHVTVRTEDQELFSGTLPGHWEALESLLDRYRGDPIQVVYEAGYFGFWLHDRLVGYGAPTVLSHHRASYLSSMVIGSRPIGETAVSWPIFWPRACSGVSGYPLSRSATIGKSFVVVDNS
jgi:hypothetical protein